MFVFDTAMLISLLPFFLAGLLGGWHCMGMCGGIVGALTAGSRPGLAFPLAYNAGRVLSYTLAGLLAGALGQGSLMLAKDLPLRLAFFSLANLLVLLMGFYLLGAGRALSWLEVAGQNLWRQLQPLTARLLPARHAGQVFVLGMIWGWLPCGLVYVALASALAAGSAVEGGAILLAFGLGTLPNLLMTAFLLDRLRRWTQHRLLRKAAGLGFVIYALHGFYAVLRLAL
jgi:sulfite exporter TauE/SafE